MRVNRMHGLSGRVSQEGSIAHRRTVNRWDMLVDFEQAVSRHKRPAVTAGICAHIANVQAAVDLWWNCLHTPRLRRSGVGAAAAVAAQAQVPRWCSEAARSWRRSRSKQRQAQQRQRQARQRRGGFTRPRCLIQVCNRSPSAVSMPSTTATTQCDHNDNMTIQFDSPNTLQLQRSCRGRGAAVEGRGAARGLRIPRQPRRRRSRRRCAAASTAGACCAASHAVLGQAGMRAQRCGRRRTLAVPTQTWTRRHIALVHATGVHCNYGDIAAGSQRLELLNLQAQPPARTAVRTELLAAATHSRMAQLPARSGSPAAAISSPAAAAAGPSRGGARPASDGVSMYRSCSAPPAGGTNAQRRIGGGSGGGAARPSPLQRCAA